MSTVSIPKPRRRKFLPEEFKVTVWSKLKPYYGDLQQRTISAVSDLQHWIYDWNEINALVREELSWRYIRLSTNTGDKNAKELYDYIVQRVLPKVIEADHLLNVKLLESPFKNELNKEQFGIYLRNIQNSLEIYHTENIPLHTDIKIKTNEYGRLISQMIIKMGDETLTIKQASRYLESPDREKRKAAYLKIGDCFLASEQPLDKLFEQLIRLRHQLALNADFENFRDYKFKALGRFDYNVQDCEHFHKHVKEQVVPAVNELYKLRKKSLQLDSLKPWDIRVAIDGTNELIPFKNTAELIEKTIHCLSGVDGFYGECLSILKEMQHLDLEARAEKQPGGYNMPLLMTGIPFIFMNTSNTLNDFIVLAHESGHAIHSFLTRQYQLNSIKSCPSEIAELAAMSMELLVMEHWSTIFKNSEEARIARLQQLERILTMLPWIAQVDEFQHWIYTHPEATVAERKSAWKELSTVYTSSMIDQNGCEDYINSSWHRQLHIFEVPFYYIEYGIAQLGAIAIWKNYRENPSETIKRFNYALSLGYSKSIPEVYEAAGISFDFSETYIRSMVDFIREEIDKCYFRIV